jgi:3-deoxy-D-manno-octulosonate 8-phosphate phosphatase (KDO 8-P phosphatase)
MNIKNENASVDLMLNIKALIFDIDGVLSDGSIYLPSDGEQLRRMNVKDSYALQLAAKSGFHVAVISGGSSLPSKNRLNKLGIWDVNLSVLNKLEKLDEILLTHDISRDEALYMGDDIPDWEVMSVVGLPCAPANAAPEILDLAQIITTKNGGEGCVREIIEKVMRSQGKWFSNKLAAQFKW